MPAANTIDADEIVIAGNGHIRVAPVGTAAPADMSASYSATWLDLGYVSEDGATVTPNIELMEVNAWQSLHPVRRQIVSRTDEFSFSLLQWSRTTLPFVLGGGAIETTGTGSTLIHTYEPQVAGDEPDYRAFSIEWSDGDKEYRLFAAKALVTDPAELALTRSAETPLPVTVSALAEGGALPFYIYTNDPAFAAA